MSVVFAFSEPVKALDASMQYSTVLRNHYFLNLLAPANLLGGMKRQPKARPAMKPDKVSMNVWCSRAFRAAVSDAARKDHRDVSKLVRMLLRERYPDLPEE